jgi:hypothetical protein
VLGHGEQAELHWSDLPGIFAKHRFIYALRVTVTPFTPLCQDVP